MKGKIAKFSAAAVIIITVVLSVRVLDTPAYALEQTIKAYEGLRYVHIENFMNGESEPREFWVELDEQEQVKRFRGSIPAWAEREGPLVGVWSEGKLQIWNKKHNVLATEHADSMGLELLNLVTSHNPRSVVKELQQLEAEGEVEITTSEPALRSEPIVITAKPLSQSNDVEQMVLHVDQNTKLVTRVIFNKLENGHQQSW